MFLYQTISCRRAFPQVAGLTLLLALGVASSGCSSWPWHHHDSDTAPEAPKAAESVSTETVAAEPQTVTSNLPDVPDSDTTTVVTETTSVALNPSAPKSYVVQHGDTLWVEGTDGLVRR